MDNGKQEQSLARALIRISNRFIHLPPEEVDAQIRQTLREVVEVLGLDRALLTRTPKPGEIASVHSYSVDGVDPAPPVSREQFPYVYERAARGEIVHFSSLDELPEEAAVDRATYAEWGVKSHVTVPLMSGRHLLGAMSFGMLRRERGFSEHELDQLQLVAHTVVNALGRKGADLELRTAFDSVSEQSRRLREEVSYLRDEIRRSHDYTEIVGDSDAMAAVLSRVTQVAHTGANVLILGETGTGKELIARAIHARSGRANGPLIKINCASLPSTLIESELFGHEKGAFTGALARKVGRFELADGGTLFLDEIGEMSADLQAKLLRVLQEGEFERLGSTRTTKVDVRVLAATNRDLEKAMAAGDFRSDLYYRLAVFPILIPPLRERREDIPLLAWHFVNKHQGELGKSIEIVPAVVIDQLCAHDWPGNVRELENIVERSLILTSGPELQLDMGGGASAPGPVARPSDDTLEEVERAHLLRVLEETGWRVKGKGNAADRLGLNESTLRFRMKKLGILRPA